MLYLLICCLTYVVSPQIMLIICYQPLCIKMSWARDHPISAPSPSAIFRARRTTSPRSPITVNLMLTPLKSSSRSSERNGVSSNRPNAQFRM